MKISSYQAYYNALITCSLIFFLCSKPEKHLIDFVDPFICTLGDHGQLHPGAAVPFGMIKLGPDTYPSNIAGDGNWTHSGYNYADDHIRGFSHLRIESSGGTRVFDRGWYLAVQPMIGTSEITPEKYATAINKQTEKASPGLYQVYLSDHKIHAALTVDKHVGFHRYTFPESQDASILFAMGSNSRIHAFSIQIINQDKIVGDFQGRAHLFFYAKLSKSFHSFSTWEDKIISNQKKIKGKKVGAILNFETKNNEIIYLKVGVSAICIEQAEKNLKVEVPKWDFDATLRRAQQAWENVLDNIIVEGEQEYETI
jgi:putative alpha-1,2-mannosidase